jgi:hypothetical protein
MPETGDAGDAGDQGRWQWGTLQCGVAANWDRWNLVKPEMGNWWAGISVKGDHGRWVLEKRDAETGGAAAGEVETGEVEPREVESRDIVDAEAEI